MGQPPGENGGVQRQQLPPLYGRPCSLPIAAEHYLNAPGFARRDPGIKFLGKPVCGAWGYDRFSGIWQGASGKAHIDDRAANGSDSPAKVEVANALPTRCHALTPPFWAAVFVHIHK